MEAKDAATKLGALAQTTRIDVIRLLAVTGEAGLAAGELASRLGQPPSTLSFHLSALEQASLLQSRRQGRRIIYSVRFAGLNALFGFLTETCCSGHPELCALPGRNFPSETKENSLMQASYNVLFICTRNSARSILAEAILENVGRGRFNAYSAGTDPAEAPMPEVLDRLATFGHEVGTLRSKAWTEFVGPDAPRMDFVITLCDVPEGETCPDLGARPITASWPFPDPAKFTGSETERVVLLNELYGMIRRRLEAFTSLPFETLDRIALTARIDELGEGTGHA